MDHSCCRGPDPVGDKSGRGSFSCPGPFWRLQVEGGVSLSFLQLQRKASFQLLGRAPVGSAAEWRGLFGDAERVWGGFFGMSKVRLIFLSKSDAKSEPSGIPFWLTFSIFRALRRDSKGLCFSEAFSSHLRRAKVGVSLRTSFKNQPTTSLQKGTSNRCPWGIILGSKFEKKRFW